MIRLFRAGDREFSGNGDVVLKPTLAVVRNEDNGDYYLDLETDLSYADLLVQDAIVVVPTPDGEQPFRLGNPVRTGQKIKSKAWHISYDTEQFVIVDSYVMEKDCAGALQHLNAATDTTSPFTVASDVSAVHSFRCIRKSLWEAIQTVLERWGGHLVRDGFNIEICSSIARDNGAVIRNGKNLEGLECSEDWSQVVTKLLPVGKDGILLNELDPQADIYVHADISYAIPYTRTLPFDQGHIVKEDYADDAAYQAALVTDLRAQAAAWVEVHKIPEINYTLHAQLDRVDGLGDIIHVRDSRLGLEFMTQVTAYEYDCVQRKITLLEFGNHKRTLSGLIPDILQRTKEAT